MAGVRSPRGVLPWSGAPSLWMWAAPGRKDGELAPTPAGEKGIPTPRSCLQAPVGNGAPHREGQARSTGDIYYLTKHSAGERPVGDSNPCCWDENPVS